MKLFKQFQLSMLLLVTSALSNHLFGRNLVKRDIFNVNLNTLDKSKECSNDINGEYKDCLVLFRYREYSNNFNEVCNIVYSEKCQEFYEDPLVFIPNCQESEEVVNALDNSIINVCLSRVSSGCETDENGNLCPIAKSFADIDKGKSFYYGALFAETCKSKKCTDALINALKGELEYANDIEELSLNNGTASLMNDLIKDLSSENCDSTAQNTDVRPMKLSQVNDATYSIKMTSYILIISIIILFYLYI